MTDYVKLGKEINTRIANVKRFTNKWNQYIHETAVMIMEHAVGEGSGDCSRAFNLYNAMGSARRREFLILWFQRYSPIKIQPTTDDKPGKAYFRKEKSKEYNPFNIDAAKANPWYSLAELEKADAKAAKLMTLGESEKAILAYVGKIRAKQIEQMKEATGQQAEELRLASEYSGALLNAIKQAGFDFIDNLKKSDEQDNDQSGVIIEGEFREVRDPVALAVA